MQEDLISIPGVWVYVADSLALYLSSFSLVFQKSQGGLEYLNRKTGEYMSTEAEEGSIYMNISDMIQRISNGEHIESTLSKNPYIYLTNA